MCVLSSLLRLHAKTREAIRPPDQLPLIPDPANVSLLPTTGLHALHRLYHSLRALHPREAAEAPLAPLLLRARPLLQKPIPRQHGLRGLPHAAIALLLLHEAAPLPAARRGVVAAVAEVAALLHAVGEVEGRFHG